MKSKITIIALAFIVVMAVWAPWYQWNISFREIFGLENSNKFSSLTVESYQNPIDVFIDDEFLGTSTKEVPFVWDLVQPGYHFVILSSKDDVGAIKITKKINFIENVNVVMGYELGPSEEFSQGHILYVSEKINQNSNFTFVNIESNIDKVDVKYDGQFIGSTPIKDFQLDLSQTHKFEFDKEGYDKLEITVLSDEQSERDKLKEYKLVLEVNLFLQPLKISL